jgi:hypothetical protein
VCDDGISVKLFWLKCGVNTKKNLCFQIIIDIVHIFGIIAAFKFKQEISPSWFLHIVCNLKRSYDRLSQDFIIT